MKKKKDEYLLWKALSCLVSIFFIIVLFIRITKTMVDFDFYFLTSIAMALFVGYMGAKVDYW